MAGGKGLTSVLKKYNDGNDRCADCKILSGRNDEGSHSRNQCKMRKL